MVSKVSSIKLNLILKPEGLVITRMIKIFNMFSRRSNLIWKVTKLKLIVNSLSVSFQKSKKFNSLMDSNFIDSTLTSVKDLNLNKNYMGHQVLTISILKLNLSFKQIILLSICQKQPKHHKIIKRNLTFPNNINKSIEKQSNIIKMNLIHLIEFSALITIQITKEKVVVLQSSTKKFLVLIS